VDILGSQVRPNNDAVLQDDISPMHTARSVQSWFEEHEDALRHLWPAQSPDLKYHRTTVVNYREQGEKQNPSSHILQAKMKFCTKNGTVLHQRLCRTNESILRKIQVVLQANGGPTPY
jgi:hypothetical protein